jgi:propanol-preferring alcohol dehydrogenase
MKAMVLEKPGLALTLRELPVPSPAPEQVLVKVAACGVCRTDLHICEGDLKEPKLPLVMGHEIVGTVVEVGEQVEGLARGDRIGVPWLGKTCGDCPCCLGGRENLCDRPGFTGYHIDGGYAEYAVADYRYCFRIPASYPDAHAAPLLCAGLIGYHSLRMAGGGRRFGLYGFGAAAHIVAQVAGHEGKEVYAFTRPKDVEKQDFARKMGADWAGDSDSLPPEPLDAAIIFAPSGHLVPPALQAVRKGGIVVCAGIHMTDVPAFPYHLLWGERRICSVANLTRQDGREFFELAARTPIRTEVETFPLAEANWALERLKKGLVRGAAVLVM